MTGSGKRNSGESAGPRLKWSLLAPGRIGGHVLDPADPERRFVVELLLDGAPVALARADLFAPDLAREDLGEAFGDGRHGFVFCIDPAALHSARRVEIRLANSDIVLAPPLPPAAAASGGAARRPGAVRWLGGLRFDGWLDPAADGAKRICATIDGEIVGQTAADLWTSVGEGREAVAVSGFELRLPERFADGCAHFMRVLDDSGRELPGSPCFFAAFADELARFVASRGEIESEKWRGEGFARAIPLFLPFSDFAPWRERFSPAAPAPEPDPAPKIGMALIGGLDNAASLASLETQEGCDWVAATLNGGEGEAAFANATLREFLDGDAADCATLVFARSGAVLYPPALALLHRALTLFPDAPAAYCDFTISAADGGEWPVALPAFDYERMLEQGFAAQIFALRSAIARAAALSGADSLYRLFNFSQDSARTMGFPLAGAPVHAPGFLARLPRGNVAEGARTLARANAAHFKARGLAAQIEPGFGALFPAVHVRRAGPLEKVSILIPARDRVDLLEPCLESLFGTVDIARHEILVLDNQSSDAATLTCFAEAARHGARVAPIGGPFDFAGIVNKGAAIASHEFLLLLENGVEALGPFWLEEMLGRLVEPDVGAVGATLLWPNGVVRNGGLVLGPGCAAAPAFTDRFDGDPGYGDLLRVAHEVSALSTACLMIERRLFREVGGLDGRHFPVHCHDVDFSLKLRARGLRLVVTPHAKLRHRADNAGRENLAPDGAERLQEELRRLRAVWGEVLLADPCYNPLLSLDPVPFAGLAFPPRPGAPRQPGVPPPRALPPGF
ncbi:glycosyltransferase [uncultured Rhodoblastus sp.]|uniref:glycosyltransferase n=1 Tax=uncultured Rhodoblastus sp. TaxID=543037 RepID=UPI0025F156B4|nr:glycosyltransferase [uncultured Rhodoblastus sp.]